MGGGYGLWCSAKNKLNAHSIIIENIIASHSHSVNEFPDF